MNTLFQRFFVLSIAATSLASMGSAWAAKLVDVRVVDEQHLAVTWLDSEVDYDDSGTGANAFRGHMSRGDDRIVEYLPKLDTQAVMRPTSFSIVREGGRATSPAAVWRRAKVIGTTHAWPEPPHALEHVVFLKLAEPMVEDATYTVRFNDRIGSDRSDAEVTFNPDSGVSEAIHVNLYGQTPGSTSEHLADLYMWLGDGGARDYSAFEGNQVWLIDAESGERHPAGTVGSPRPRSNRDLGRFDFTASDVWPIDFTLPPNAEGPYRLVVEGVGSSPVFAVSHDSLRDPFALSVIGFYYMRIGEPKDARVPAPRQPRLIPGEDPPGFQVIRTTLNPKHPDWESLRNDPWDHKDWSAYVEPGEPTNPNAYGGYADALDWDRRHRHIQIVWDLCLPFLLTDGQPADDDLGLPDSGNGIPDLLDAARYGADFWLRLRDGDGNYSMGINNPLRDKSRAYQAKAEPWMAWANAANAAILADAFRATGHSDLSNDYRDEAIEAWEIAGDRDLDHSRQLGTTQASGRDMKALAAACLFNLTGDRAYEEAFIDSCMVTNPGNRAGSSDWYRQNWAVAAYLMGSRTVPGAKHRRDIVRQLESAVHDYALARHVRGFRSWPSRRSTSGHGHFQSVAATQPLMTAHAIAEDSELRDEYLAALIGEADWGLGRNPLNMVLMTGPDAQTGIGTGMRHVQDIYTSGRNDGTPGLHPGHTPFMNANPWGGGNFMNDPRGWYGSRGYPAWQQWPYGEALWQARYCFANNEFTPQKTMSGKSALLGYLHAVTSTPNE
ncbi:MAG: glycoside hydrolase family 9 protein [Planctomycetota bacterium]